MNNDVVVSPGWVEKLINAGIEHNCEIVSPAMVEGNLDYDFLALTEKASQKMMSYARVGWSHAVCLAVHKRVWEKIGYFRATPSLLGYEDTIFFHEARGAGIRMCTTGASWLHHFGSITQSAMKRERGLKESDELGYRYNHRLLNQSWLERKLDKIRINNKLKHWRIAEVNEFEISLLGESKNNSIIWK